MNSIILTVISALLFTAFATSVEAAFAITHQGSTDPNSEVFTFLKSSSPSSVGPISNDLGNDAWSVAGTSTGSQFYYVSGSLSNTQRFDITNYGFTLSLNARALQGFSPSYTYANPYVFAFANIDTGTRRFDIMLGMDNQGDTVVTLPTSYSVSGASTRAYGPSLTLVDSGSSYHNYELIYDPNTLLANLFVDGVERIQNYAGNAYFLSNWGLGWGVAGGGQANFSFVKLATPVPLPAAVWLFGAALAGLGLFGKSALRS